ncbi:cupin domain-containing protein [Simiaoa sp.]|uniref:cupin domain-containing protein n=1 Tax=Simiaoa sp. TaxID=2944202 RepID=UPI003F80F3B2
MVKFNIFEDIEGVEFPAGRRGRVMYGENGKVNGEYFCQGYSVVYPGGGIPVHQHETVETYTILSGTGEMYVDGEKQPLKAGDSIYIDHNQCHGLKNTGTDDMHVMYVYAPKMIVDHWAQEQAGELK